MRPMPSRASKSSRGIPSRNAASLIGFSRKSRLGAKKLLAPITLVLSAESGTFDVPAGATFYKAYLWQAGADGAPGQQQGLPGFGGKGGDILVDEGKLSGIKSGVFKVGQRQSQPSSLIMGDIELDTSKKVTGRGGQGGNGAPGSGTGSYYTDYSGQPGYSGLNGAAGGGGGGCIFASSVMGGYGGGGVSGIPYDAMGYPYSPGSGGGGGGGGAASGPGYPRNGAPGEYPNSEGPGAPGAIPGGGGGGGTTTSTSVSGGIGARGEIRLIFT